ncbi:MAG: class I SAM-dependent methyltransferase [Polyangiaceae bacterium]
MPSFDHDSRDLAETYDRVSDYQFDGGKRLVERLGLKAGQRLLDVGSGTGRLAGWIAGIVGPDHVTGIEPLSERVAIARKRVPGVTFEVGQAESLGAFADATFDAVCMSAVFHWIGDKPRALAEAKRVLRPGGKLGLTTVVKELRAASSMTRACVQLFSREPYVGKVAPTGLSMAQVGATVTDLLSMLTFAGLEVLELHVIQRTHVHPSGDAVVDFADSSSFGNFLKMVPDELRASFRRDLAAIFESARGPDGVAMRDHGMVVVAERA